MIGQEIARLAEIRFNRAAGEILRQILRHGEATSRGCKDVEASGWLLRRICGAAPIQFFLVTEPVNRMNILKRLPTDINLLLEDSPGDKLSEYLETLSMESDQFLKKSSSAGGGTFIVPIQHVVTQIKQRIIESMITEKFGDEHKRIWRILLKKGKLEEKQVECSEASNPASTLIVDRFQVTQCAMTPKKVVCRCLYDLHNAGFVHIQVPHILFAVLNFNLLLIDLYRMFRERPTMQPPGHSTFGTSQCSTLLNFSYKMHTGHLQT